jgi:hypothetical protein
MSRVVEYDASSGVDVDAVSMGSSTRCMSWWTGVAFAYIEPVCGLTRIPGDGFSLCVVFDSLSPSCRA